jgi:hypothetical protein
MTLHHGCSDCFDWRLSPSGEEDRMRRPQRPGIPQRAMTRLGNPPAIHPREPPATVSLSAIRGNAFKTSTRALADTLLELESAGNRNFVCACAEAVEHESSLWKRKEKEETIHHGGRESQRHECKRKGAISRALLGRDVGQCVVRLVPDSIHKRAQFARAGWMAQLAQGLSFDLADALASYGK